MLIVVFLILLAVTGGAAAGAGWTLHARGPLSGWLGDHLPAWLIRHLKRLGEWFDSGETKPPRKGPPPPAPLERDYGRVMGGGRQSFRAPAPVLPGLPEEPAVSNAPTGSGLSPAQAAVVAETGGFEPEDDAELIAHMRREIAFQNAHAGAFRNLLDHLLHSVRADPSSVHGVSEYADVRADSAHDAVGMLNRYLTVYAEIKEFRANGGVLPIDGDWITPEGA